jgi:hypothetical protein
MKSKHLNWPLSEEELDVEIEGKDLIVCRNVYSDKEVELHKGFGGESYALFVDGQFEVFCLDRDSAIQILIQHVTTPL